MEAPSTKLPQLPLPPLLVKIWTSRVVRALRFPLPLMWFQCQQLTPLLPFLHPPLPLHPGTPQLREAHLPIIEPPTGPSHTLPLSFPLPNSHNYNPFREHPPPHPHPMYAPPATAAPTSLYDIPKKSSTKLLVSAAATTIYDQPRTSPSPQLPIHHAP